ncbi:zinc-binding dehydrogenase [Patescibacteria group bacterium]|nr:zinc-binding dehydrogenase [Desulfobacteraceae bacterium]MBU4027156.1 zinc-binding dehydrogenase [Patescibacteria group bacterium]MBU4069272.1 zinc-binding dehydrogenase [Pseudomonadota bacterium]
MKTKAAVLYEINEPLQIEELTIPELRSGQVLVKIAYSGICRSQLNEIRGLKGQDKFLPHTLGHEGSGIVEAIGLGVSKVKPGDHVVLTWIKGKGAEIPSTLYKKADGSVVNSGAISTFMTKAVISENRLVKIPPEMPLREAALLGCAIPTGAGIVLNTLRVQSGNSIAIFGVGGIGLSAVLAARLMNATPIIAVDVFDHKLKLARDVGATHLINASQGDPLTTIMKITDGRGVDYAIEAAGRRETMESAFQAVRNNGGLCVLAGNLLHGERISLDPFDLIKGKQIIGTWGGETDPDRDIPQYIRLYQASKLKLDELITDTFSLDEINKTIDMMSKGKITGRCLIEMPEQDC